MSTWDIRYWKPCLHPPLFLPSGKLKLSRFKISPSLDRPLRVQIFFHIEDFPISPNGSFPEALALGNKGIHDRLKRDVVVSCVPGGFLERTFLL